MTRTPIRAASIAASDAPQRAASVADRGAGDQDALAGVALMALAMLFIPGIDAVAKYVGGQGVPPLQIAWSRFLFQILFVAPIVLALVGVAGLWPKRMGLVALRGVLMGLATFFFFTALQYMPMADAISIFFVEPLILTILSAVFLGERIGWRRVSAVLIGFAGALLIVRPSFVDVGWPALLPIATAFTFAIYLLLTKRLVDEHPLTLHLWAGVGGFASLGVLMAAGAAAGAPAFAPIWPSAAQWSLLALLGVIATGGHFLIVLAFRRAPASLLAPLQYLEIVSATLLGFLIFGDFPTALTWLGVALIVGSGLFVIWRGRAAKTAVDQPASDKRRAVSGS